MRIISTSNQPSPHSADRGLMKGLVGWWPFMGSGKSVSDFSDYGGHLDFVNSPTWGGPAGHIRHKGALQFNGTSDLTEGTIRSIDMPFTLAAWGMMPPDAQIFANTGHAPQLFGLSTTNHFERASIGFHNTGNTFATVVARCLDDQSGIIVQAQGSTDNLWDRAMTWIHVIGVFASSTERHVYQNAVLQGSDTTEKAPSALVQARMGGARGYSSEFLDSHGHMGWVADARVYNRVLSEREMQILADPNLNPFVSKRIHVAAAAAAGFQPAWVGSSSHLAQVGGMI